MINPLDFIVYEDDNYVIVNKPFGIPSAHSTDKNLISMHDMISDKYKEKIFVVHRIDKDASGLLVFAKNADAHKYLSYLFMNNLLNKEYIAVVHGEFPSETKIINKKIRQFGSGRMGVSETGKDALTKVTLIKSFGNYSLLNVEILTGRRHQIRVHLYSEGFPIVGDKLYGNKEIQLKFSRMMLHCYHLCFSDRHKKLTDIIIQNDNIIEEFIKSFEND